MKMSNDVMIILNVISILLLLAFISYLSYIVEAMNKAVMRWIMGDKSEREYIRNNKMYLWCYPLIPTLLSIAVVQISQLNVGIPYIKTDWAFIASNILWICMFFFVKSLHDKAKKNE